MVQWLRRRFIAGLVVTVPLIATVAALVWVFRLIDGAMAPPFARWFGRDVPGLGLVLTALIVLLAGVVATNMVGRRILQRAEAWLLYVPLFKTVYAPVKQLVAAFSPDNEYGFKRVVVADEPGRGLVLGFLTREFTLARGDQLEAMVVVYVPTNHLYLGDVMVYPADRVMYPDLSVQDGIRIFLTGGMAVPPTVAGRPREMSGPGGMPPVGT